MKSLREYKLQVEPPTSQSNRITWGGSFPTAIHGTVNGIPCRAIQVGDMPGASTVLLVSTTEGFFEVKRADFLPTDGAYLPLVESPAIERVERAAKK
jgi:hypothetical protein